MRELDKKGNIIIACQTPVKTCNSYFLADWKFGLIFWLKSFFFSVAVVMSLPRCTLVLRFAWSRITPAWWRMGWSTRWTPSARSPWRRPSSWRRRSSLRRLLPSAADRSRRRWERESVRQRSVGPLCSCWMSSFPMSQQFMYFPSASSFKFVLKLQHNRFSAMT